MYYVAVDVGCIECGEATNVLGIFTDEKEAQSVIEDHEKRQSKNWSGQHSFYIEQIEEINKVRHINYDK